MTAVNRVKTQVIVDGSVVTTINANTGRTVWRETYTSPSFTPGTHTYIDIDAITIQP